MDQEIQRLFLGIMSSLGEAYLQNKFLSTVNAATDLYKKSGAESMIALGGGSPMDVANYMLTENGFTGAMTLVAGLLFVICLS